MNIYLINSFSLRLLEEELANIVGKSTNVIRMNMSEHYVNDLINECSYYSLLQEQKYVIASNFKLNKDNNIIIDYIKDPMIETTLILVTDKIDKRSVIFKEVSKLGKVIIIDDLKDINNKINIYCKSKNIEIDYFAINQLLTNNLNNYDLVLNEIDKINIITNKITKEEVDKYSIKLIGDDNFGFSDAVINKNYPEIKKQLENFINLRSEIFPFIGLLASQYRLMYAVSSLSGSNDEIAKLLEIHPYRVKLAREKLHHYTKDELQKKLLDLCDLDYNLKTTNIDSYTLFKIFIVNV